MPAAKYDWSHWYLVFKQIKKHRENLTLSQFCREHDLPYDCCRLAFKARKEKEERTANLTEGECRVTEKKNRKKFKHDWVEYKADYFESDIISLAEWARRKGLNPNSGAFKKQTKNWGAEKRTLRARVQLDSIGDVGGMDVARVHSEILYQLSKVMELIETASEKGFVVQDRVVYPHDWLNYVSALNKLIVSLKKFWSFITKILGYKEAQKILGAVKNGEMGVTEASYRFEILGVPLPKALEIDLRRAEEELEECSNEMLTDEELERLYKESLAKMEEQKRNFLPKRRREVEKLKREFTESGCIERGEP